MQWRIHVKHHNISLFLGHPGLMGQWIMYDVLNRAEYIVTISWTVRPNKSSSASTKVWVRDSVAV